MVRINQLFRREAPIEIARSLARVVGLKDLNDTSYFTKYDVRRMDAMTRVKPICDKLHEYYLPCKARMYLDRDPMSERAVIVIMKQVLRLHNYSIKAMERNFGNKKIMVYQLVNDNKPNPTLHVQKRSCIMTFD